MVIWSRLLLSLHWLAPDCVVERDGNVSDTRETVKTFHLSDNLDDNWVRPWSVTRIKLWAIELLGAAIAKVSYLMRPRM